MRPILILLGLFIISTQADATTCKNGDWVPAICSAKDWGLYQGAGSRCWEETGTRANQISGCTNATVGCPELGGCFGSVPPGHWVVTVINGVKVRCQCGCFVEETKFGPEGISGVELIESQRLNPGVGGDLTSINPFSQESRQSRINGIVFGPAKDEVIELITPDAKAVVTKAHPVVVADQSGELRLVKAASKIDPRTDKFLMTSDFQAIPLLSIKRSRYNGTVVNFNVVEDDARDHFVSADGLIMGDNAWQQVLAAEELRLLRRSDILSRLSE